MPQEKSSEITTSLSEHLTPIGAEKVARYATAELARIQPLYNRLIEIRHALFDSKRTELSPSRLKQLNDPGYEGRQVSDLLYEDPGYNRELIASSLRTRTPGSSFHEEFEKFDDTLKEGDDSLARKRAWRTELIKISQEFGGYGTDLLPGVSTDPLDRQFGVRESQLSPEHPIVAETAIVAGAAGMSNFMRGHDIFRNIRSGAVVTDTIIFTAGERAIPTPEKQNLINKGLPAGDTEYEAIQYAVEYLTGTSLIDSEEFTIDAPYGTNTPPVKYKRCTINLDGKEVTVTVLEAAYDRDRRFEGGKAPDRANTQETFLAALPLLDKSDGTLLVESHDVWTPYQEVIAQQTFGLYGGKDIVTTGPFKDDRMKLKPVHNWAVATDGTTEKQTVGYEDDPDILAAQALLDEIAKKQIDLTKILTEIEQLTTPDSQDDFLQESATHAKNV